LPSGDRNDNAASLMSPRYRTIDVSGRPRALGRQLGEAAGEEIRAFAAVAMECVNRTVRISRDAALQVARGSIAYAEEYRPDLVEELRGTAEAARVTLEELMLLQVRNQLQPEPGCGCTSLSCVSSSAGGLVAQNWDNDPALDAFTIVLTRRPTGKPASMSVTQAGLIGYIGLSETGIGVCLNTLPAPSRRLGVPHYFVVRALVEADSLGGAVAEVHRASRAIPANIMLMTPQGPADLEVTIDSVEVVRDMGSRWVTHTNHCRHPALWPINGAFPELIQSQARQKRIDTLLGAEGEPLSVGRVQQALRDHEDYPRSICRHRNDDPVHGFWQTVFSAIIEPQAGSMQISRGTPCDHPYEVYRLS
jgi:isopenicillin-N N-acyltransferase-like protein